MPWDEQEAAFHGSDREFHLWLYQEFSRLMFYTAQSTWPIPTARRRWFRRA